MIVNRSGGVVIEADILEGLFTAEILLSLGRPPTDLRDRDYCMKSQRAYFAVA